MKKIIALLMALSMLFVLVACSQPCVNHTDEDHDQKCDVCGADVECANHLDDDGNYTCDYCGADVTPEGVKLSQGVALQLKGAKSAKLMFSYELDEQISEWEYDENEEPVLDEDGFKTKGNIYITVAKTDTLVNVQLESEGFEYDEQTKEWTSEDGRQVKYVLVDGVLYSEYGNGYFISQDTPMAQAVEMLSALLDGVEPTEGELAEMYQVFGERAITSFNIFENKGSSVIDFKPIVDNLKAYFAELDFETATLADVLDYLLAGINPELTSEKLIAEIARVGALTVNELLAELDTKLTADYKTTLQGIYDSIVSDPRFAIILHNYVEYMAKMSGEDVPEEEITAQYEAVLAEAKAFKIADIIEDAGIGEVTVYNLFLSLVAPEPTDGEEIPSPPTLEETVAMLETVLALTIAEYEECYDVTFFSTLAMGLAGFEIRAFDIKTDVQFKGVFEIDSITATLNLDATLETNSDVEGKKDIDVAKGVLSVKLYDISTTDVVINAPAGDKVLVIPLEEYIPGSEDDTYGAQHMELWDNDTNIGVELYLSADEGDICVVAYIEDIGQLTNTTVTIPADNVSLHNNDYEWTYPTDDTPLVIEYDPVNGEFVIVSMPAYTFPGMTVEKALEAIGYGKNTDNSVKYDIDPKLDIYFDWLAIYTDTPNGVLHFNGIDIGYTFDYYLEDDGSMVCTITGAVTGSSLLIDANGGTFVGTTTDAEDLALYFGEDLEFTLYLTDGGLVTSDDFPTVNPEYIVQNA